MNRVSKGWQGGSEGFPEGEAKGNHKEQPCQPEDNLVLPTLLLGFTFYLEQDVLVIFLNFSNIDV